MQLNPDTPQDEILAQAHLSVAVGTVGVRDELRFALKHHGRAALDHELGSLTADQNSEYRNLMDEVEPYLRRSVAGMVNGHTAVFEEGLRSLLDQELEFTPSDWQGRIGWTKTAIELRRAWIVVVETQRVIVGAGRKVGQSNSPAADSELAEALAAGVVACGPVQEHLQHGLLASLRASGATGRTLPLVSWSADDYADRLSSLVETVEKESQLSPELPGPAFIVHKVLQLTNPEVVTDLYLSQDTAFPSVGEGPGLR